MFDHLPPAKRLIADRPYDTTLYRQRYRVEVMFGRLKDWRRIAMRYDRCAHTFMSAIVIAATIKDAMSGDIADPSPMRGSSHYVASAWC